ncbi:MAG: hypothetical protein ABF242_04020 [Flavobacteriales bacterium]
MKLKLAILAAVTGMAVIMSCNKDGLSERQITDTDGLRIELEWNTGGSSSQALSDVDLDLILTKGSTPIADSDNLNSFESLSITNSYTNGVYGIEYDYFSGNVNPAYTLYVTGISSGTRKTYTGTIDRTETNDLLLLTIDKDGSEYLITEQ